MKTKKLAILLILLFSISVFAQTKQEDKYKDVPPEIMQGAADYFENNKEKSRDILNDYLLIKIVIDEAFDGKRPTDEEQLYQALKGLVRSTGDVHSVFLTPNEVKIQEGNFEGEFGGIGVVILNKEQYILVTEVTKGDPADKAGIQKGDKIYGIGGATGNFLVKDLSSDERLLKLRGKIGEKVVLLVLKNGATSGTKIELTRAEIKPAEKHLSVSVVDGIPVIKIPVFSEALSEEQKNAVMEIMEKYPDSPLVVDLRDNPGGYIESARETASFWLGGKEVFFVQKMGAKTKNILVGGPYYVDDKVYAEKYSKTIPFSKRKTVVLVNEYSASASEMLAGALRDNKNINATLIGKKTFGKGSTQYHMPMPGGSMLILTVAHQTTPLGTVIDNKGLEPDIAVDMPEDNAEKETEATANSTPKKDPQLERAIEFLKTGK